jgi:hypothetical protein
VEYLNPFQVVGVGPAVDQQVLSEVAHLFAETIGLALRRIGTSPIEITLIPDYVRKQNEFRSKRPYFFASAAAILLYLFITLWAYSQQADNIAAKRDEFNSFVSRQQAIQQRVKSANNKLLAANSQYDSALELLKQRNNLIAFYSLIKSCIPDNVWLTEFTISTSPSSQIKNATVIANTPSTEEGDGNKTGGQLTMDMGDNSQNQDSGKKEEAEGDGSHRWVNMVAYVICDKMDSTLNDRSAAINNITSKMKENDGIFKAKDEEIMIVYDEGRDICDHLSISKFLLAVELKEPVDSPELEKELTKKFSPASATEQAQ